MRVSVLGKLDNTQFPSGRPLQPLFEAMANSFHAIEDAGDGPHRLDIECMRRTDMIDSDAAPPTDFIVTDTGVGFTTDNTASFFVAESRYKSRRGAKGNGRFLWLKAFNKVDIDSHFLDETGKLARRAFTFEKRDDLEEPPVMPATAHKTGSRVALLGLDEQLAQRLTRPAEIFAEWIVAHFLPFFRAASCPDVWFTDASGSIHLNEFFKDTSPEVTDRSSGEVTLDDKAVYRRAIRDFGTREKCI